VVTGFTRLVSYLAELTGYENLIARSVGRTMERAVTIRLYMVDGFRLSAVPAV
jgi:hypothetical protein